MTHMPHPLHDIKTSLQRELENERPSEQRRAYIYGYINAHHGRQYYGSVFSGSSYNTPYDAEPSQLLKAYANGVKDSVSNNVALYGGLSDGYNFVMDDKIKRSRHGRVMLSAFFDGVADGYDRLFTQEKLTARDVAAFILAAGEQKRRNESPMRQIPYDMEWPHPSPVLYARIKKALRDPSFNLEADKYEAFLDMIESFPRLQGGDGYEKIIDDGDLRYLISEAPRLGALNVLCEQLYGHFQNPSPSIRSLLKGRTQQLGESIFMQEDYLAYTYYAKGSDCAPRGLVGKAFQQVESTFNAMALEVENRTTLLGRLFVTFNTHSGIRIVDRTADEWKEGIPYKTLEASPTLPDTYLHPKQVYENPEGGTPEERAEYLCLREKLDERARDSQRERYAEMRASLPAIQTTIAKMGLLHASGSGLA